MAKQKKKKQNGIPASIRWTAKILEKVNPKWASQFAIRLFTTPIRHKRPNRENALFARAQQSKLVWNDQGEHIQLYQWGSGSKKALVVHGWSGRGTQLVKLIDALVENDFTVYSYDAPAHGLSDGKHAVMTYFIECNLLLDTKFGPFDAAIGHSLGSMSLFNALNDGLRTKCFVGIGSGNSVWHIIEQFVLQIGQSPKMIDRILHDMGKKFKTAKPIVDYSAFAVAPNINIPVLMIHDVEDKDVPIGAMRMMKDKLRNLEMMETKGLGHRKILGDAAVIEKSLSFIQKHV